MRWPWTLVLVAAYNYFLVERNSTTVVLVLLDFYVFFSERWCGALLLDT